MYWDRGYRHGQNSRDHPGSATKKRDPGCDRPGGGLRGASSYYPRKTDLYGSSCPRSGSSGLGSAMKSKFLRLGETT